MFSSNSRYHTTGTAIYSNYEDNPHNWYSQASHACQPFWERYRRFLTEKSSLDPKSIALLDRTTLPRIMECLSNPMEIFEGKKLCRGLIIGDVQSGKTSTYIGLMCKAIDAGYKVVILLAGTTETLRQQTQERVDEGIIGWTLPKDARVNGFVRVGVGEYTAEMPATAFTSVQRDFAGGTEKIATSLNFHRTVVFVCKKNVSVLRKLHGWLRDLNLDEAKGYVDAPLLLIDDEADNASINTKADETDPTKTNKIIRDICNLFKNATYVGFTATPYANIFIAPDSVDQMRQADLFPEDFIYTLPTPSSYIGASRLFYPNGDHYANLRFIADINEPDYGSGEYREMVESDIDTLNHGSFYHLHKKEWDGILPESLREAVLCFFVANAIRDLRGDRTAPRSMLVNMSRYVKVQYVISKHIEDIYAEVCGTLCYDFNEERMHNERLPLYQELLSVMARHFSHIRDVSVYRVLEKTTLEKAVENIRVVVVNGSRQSAKLDYKAIPDMRVIAVGGLALSRGLTLEGLLVSYFYRNTATFAVLMQMGRWFGYRHKYDDLFQVWTTRASAMWYEEISKASEALKEEVRLMYGQHLTPKDFGLKVRDDCDQLQITARNKMRSASDFYMRVAYYGNIYDTPYLSVNPNDNAQNLEAVGSFANKLFAHAYPYRFASYRMTGKDARTSPETGTRYFSDVPKSVVRDFMGGIHCSLFNVNFNVEAILSFIDEPDNVGLDYWDVAFEAGDGEASFQIPLLSNIQCSKRTIYDHGNAIQIGSRRRLLGTREGKFGV